MRFVSVLIGKVIFLLLKILGRSGSALPGLVIEKINPGFLKQNLSALPLGFVVVTGTNGKTTTTKIISDLLKSRGLKVLTNDTGSNFVRGVISTVIKKSTWGGKLPYDIAILEQDEAHAVRLAEFAQPRGVVALNVMRDQLDRFGEIDTTAKLIGKLVGSAQDFVVLNSNDARIAALAGQVKAKHTFWFGHSRALAADFTSDDHHHSNGEAEFFEAHKPNVSLNSLDDSRASLLINDKNHQLDLILDGAHNALNATAALTVAQAAFPGGNTKRLLQALENVQPAFGRGEVVKLKSGANLRVQLVKNPGGFTHSLKLLDQADYSFVGIMINDDHADGRDVSWLWDVDFTELPKKEPTNISCGGTRAYDMAVRLKYDGVKSTLDQPQLGKYVRSIADKSGSGVIFCTYTAMLQLRRELAKYSDEISGAIL